MPRQLWVLRHGEAEPHDAKSDAQRELTPRGEEQSEWAGKALAALGVELAAVWTSPKVRARETARLACKALGVEPIVYEPLAEGFDVDDLEVLLEAAGPDDRILIVGHEPDFSQLVHDLTGGRIDLKKGGVAAVGLETTRRGELIALLRPRELQSIAR
jgi:phosphohistidine phosphatase